jgi:hypothetical protein
MVDVNVTSTTDIDVSLSNSYSLLLDMNTTLTFSGEEAGAKFRLWITQDGTGGRAITWPAVTWAAGSAPVLSTTAGSTNWVDLEYDGTTWYGAWDQTGGGGTGGPDPGEYDLVFDASEKNVDLFRRLGSPVSPQTWEVAISPGVVIHSDSILEESLNLGGAFPSGTIINILNQGYVIGKGGRGASAIGAQKHGDAAYSFGNNKPTAGGNAIKGPATGVTVNINNGNGYVWGGGGGGGAGAINCRNDGGGIGGAGGGGAGGGEGGLGGYLRLRGNTYGASVADAANGRLNLDGTAAGGAGSNGAGVDADGDTDDYSVGNGGAGGDYGSAGAAGGAGTPFTGSGAMDIPATAGGAAGRAVTAGYAGTLTFTSGGTSPNVKGSV